MTYHSIQRTCERANMKYNSAIKMIQRAEEKGTLAEELPAKERRFVAEKQGDGIFIIYYLGYLFIMSEDGVCITMYSAPDWFCRKGNFHGKRKIKNLKKYQRYHREMTSEHLSERKLQS